MTSAKNKDHRKSVACAGLNIYTEIHVSPKKDFYILKHKIDMKDLVPSHTHNIVTLSETELIDVKLRCLLAGVKRKTTWLLISLS